MPSPAPPAGPHRLRPRPDAVIGAFAVRQHGVVGRDQLRKVGLPAHIIDYRVRTGRMRRLYRGVHGVGPVAAPLEPLMAAVLASGATAVVSHSSAADVWKLWPWERRGGSRRPEGRGGSRPPERRGGGRHSGWQDGGQPLAGKPSRESSPAEVSVRGGHRVPGPSVRVHRVPDLRDDEVAIFEGIPVTTPARTILDLAGSLWFARELEAMVARAERKKLAAREEVTALVARYPRRPGTRTLRALLTRGEAPALTRSELEAEILDLTRIARLPTPRTNVLLLGYEVDFFFPGAGVVLEVDGFPYHSSRASFEADRRRDGMLEAAGYRVIRVTWCQIRNEREAVLVRLGQALIRGGPPQEAGGPHR